MDFTLTEAQRDLADLTRSIVTDRVTQARLRRSDVHELQRGGRLIPTPHGENRRETHQQTQTHARRAGRFSSLFYVAASCR